MRGNMKYTVNSLETVTVENEEIVGIMESTKWNKENVEWKYTERESRGGNPEFPAKNLE